MRAPAGGTVSIVNDKHYVGGQFLPEHGLFCGKKGAKRLNLWNSVADGLKVNLGGRAMYELMIYEGNGDWRRVGVAIADTAEQARLSFQPKYKRSVYAWGR
jgi:hypothetical protein